MVALERIAKVLFASSIDASQVEIDPTLGITPLSGTIQYFAKVPVKNK